MEDVNPGDFEESLLRSTRETFIDPSYYKLLEEYNQSLSEIRKIGEGFLVNKSFSPQLITPQVKGNTWIFFTKPYLNIDVKKKGLIEEAKNFITSDYGYENFMLLDLMSYSSGFRNWLVENLNYKASQSSLPFVPLLTNLAKPDSLNSTIQDEVSEALKFAETKVGSSMSSSRGNSFRSFSGEFSVSFQEISGLYLTHYFKTIMKYIYYAYKGKIRRSKESRKLNYIDFMSSAYILVTDADGENIIYWAKYSGITPLELNLSSLSAGGGAGLFEPEVKFSYSFREAMSSYTINELSMLFRNAIPRENSDSSMTDYASINKLTPSHLIANYKIVSKVLPENLYNRDSWDVYPSRRPDGTRNDINHFANISSFPYIETLPHSTEEATTIFRLKFLHKDFDSSAFKDYDSKDKVNQLLGSIQ